MFGTRWHIYKQRQFAEGLCYYLSSLCKEMNVGCERGTRKLLLLVPVGLSHSLHWSLLLGLYSVLIIWGTVLVFGEEEKISAQILLVVLGEKH